jgi:hypothetical protein
MAFLSQSKCYRMLPKAGRKLMKPLRRAMHCS